MKTNTKQIVMILIFLVLIAGLFVGCGSSGGGVTTNTVTLNPVLDFYINRTLNTDTSTVVGYGVDSDGTYTTGSSGSTLGTTLPPGAYNYQNFFKLLYNFNITTLSGATIQSAKFRIYQANVSGSTPQPAMIENIFYGNTGSFPTAPRDYASEFGGYTVTPNITATVNTTTTGWKEFDVTAKLQADINASRSNSQFRLNHQNAANLITYSCTWNMADNATNRPELVVTYTK